MLFRSPARSGRSGAALWGAACVACVLAITAGAFFILGRHPGAGTPAPRQDTAAAGPLASANLPIPEQVNGIWSGTIHQNDPSLKLAVRLSLPGGSRHGTLAYPQLGCTGRLALTSATHTALTFHLAFTGRRSSCAPGVIRLVPHGSTLTFTFLRQAGSNPSGTLTRQG